MTRDPIKYKDPEEFKPERFLTEAGELNDDEVSYAFGFGRRSVVLLFSNFEKFDIGLCSICPGRHLTASSVNTNFLIQFIAVS